MYTSDTFFTSRIYTKNGFTKNPLGDIVVLDVGCGERKLPGAIGMDQLALSGVDVVHDINIYHWPFNIDTFDLVLVNHALEHVENVVFALEEIHRVLRPGGHVVIQVPYFRSVDSFSDPTHKHFFTARSLDYFIEGTVLANYKYSSVLFRKVGFWYGWPNESRNFFVRSFKRLIHYYPCFYDQFLSIIVPNKCITWELEKI